MFYKCNIMLINEIYAIIEVKDIIKLISNQIMQDGYHKALIIKN